MGLILDSSVAVAAERRGDTIEQFIQRIVDALAINKRPCQPLARPSSFMGSTVLIRQNDVHAVKLSWKNCSPLLRFIRSQSTQQGWPANSMPSSKVEGWSLPSRIC